MSEKKVASSQKHALSKVEGSVVRMGVQLSNLKPALGSRHRRKILGRGEGSGHGQTATRGMKGQNSRSGDSITPGFQGGQVPLMRRLPKRGFNNKNFTKRYAVVQLGQLERYFSAGDKVSAAELHRLGIVRRKHLGVKILGSGKLSKNLTVKVDAMSASAKTAIEKAGGKVEKSESDS